MHVYAGAFRRWQIDALLTGKKHLAKDESKALGIRICKFGSFATTRAKKTWRTKWASQFIFYLVLLVVWPGWNAMSWSKGFNEERISSEGKQKDCKCSASAIFHNFWPVALVFAYGRLFTASTNCFLSCKSFRPNHTAMPCVEWRGGACYSTCRVQGSVLGRIFTFILKATALFYLITQFLRCAITRAPKPASVYVPTDVWFFFILTRIFERIMCKRKCLRNYFIVYWNRCTLGWAKWWGEGEREIAIRPTANTDP